MATSTPTPTGVLIGGVQYPAGDLYNSGGQQYLQQNGQYYTIGAGGQLTPAPSSVDAKLNQTFSTAPASGNANDNINYASLLPTAAQEEAFAPLPYQSFGDVPYTQAATVTPASVASTPNAQAAQMQSIAGPTAASVDLSQMPGALSSFEGDVNTALAPTFQQQQDALTANQADRGIFNSTAGLQLQNNLSGQQDAALASAYEPLVSQFAGAYTSGEEQNSSQQQAANLAGYQGNLSTGELNTGNQQATNLANYSGSQDYNSLVAQLQQQAAVDNQSATNTSNTNNANMYNNVVVGNTTSYNDYLNSLMTNQNSLSTGLLNDVVASYDPGQYTPLLSAGTTSAGNAYTGAYQTAAANGGTLSNALSQLGGSLNLGGNSSSASGAGVADMQNASFSDY